MKLLAVFVIACSFGGALSQVLGWGKCPDVSVQEGFDVNQYMGKWYENRRFFAIFEFGTDCVSATYALDGAVVNVTNTGYSKYTRKANIAYGTAVAENTSQPAKLGVSFSPDQPRGDYWVLATDYTSYSVVYSCIDAGPNWFPFNFQIVWILTREPAGAAEAKTAELLQLMTDQGINVKNFGLTNQQNCPSPA